MASPFPHPASPPTPDEALPSPRPSTARATQLLLLQRGTTGTCVYPFLYLYHLQIQIAHKFQVRLKVQVLL